MRTDEKCWGLKASAWIGLWAAAQLCYATSTGLNNIPTADTPPDRTVVFQAFSNQRHDGDDDYVIGLKMGLRPWGQRFEWGVDGRLGEGGSGPAVFQGKYAFQPWDNLPTFAIGFTNLAVTSEDRERVGEPFKFLVLTQDFKLLRGHAGYGIRQDNNAAFFGLDKTIQLLGRDLVLRADVIQTNDQHDWLGSIGFLYALHEHFVVESWVSQPFDDGSPIFTLKLNFIWKF